MKLQNISLVLLRLAMGWTFFYAGLVKILDKSWSAAGYIQGAKNFPHFYAYFLDPKILPTVNLLNEWGLLLIGAALILGLFVRLSAFLGIILMALYYFVLPLPHPNANSYIVDEHVIYACALLVLAAFNAGKFLGLGNKIG